MILSAEQVKSIKKSTGYRGRNVKTEQFHPGMKLSSYWDEGSRDVFFRINLMDGSCKTVPGNGGPFQGPAIVVDELAPGEVIAEVSTFRSKQVGLYIHTGRD